MQLSSGTYCFHVHGQRVDEATQQAEIYLLFTSGWLVALSVLYPEDGSNMLFL
jgi:hypothetical protein